MYKKTVAVACGTPPRPIMMQPDLRIVLERVKRKNINVNEISHNTPKAKKPCLTAGKIQNLEAKLTINLVTKLKKKYMKRIAEKRKRSCRGVQKPNKSLWDAKVKICPLNVHEIMNLGNVRNDQQSQRKCFDDDAVEECTMLADPKLSLFTDEEEMCGSYEVDTPQHRITQFSVYDKRNHLCPFDTGLIEKSKKLFLSGYVKPIYDDNCDANGGIPTKDIGPIEEWWITGFDGGNDVIIGLSTELAEYVLMAPSEEYSFIMDATMEKAYISKIVIEFILENPETSYENLLNTIQTSVLPNRNTTITEHMLFKNAQFLVEQVENFDSFGNDYDLPLLTTPCMKDLIKLSGVTLEKSIKGVGRETTKRKKEKETTKATTTPLVRHVFDIFFRKEIEEKSDSPVKRRGRCNVCRTCQKPDCGKCKECRNMKKFGGTGLEVQQGCINRRCENIATEETNDCADKANQDVEVLSKNVKWIGDPIRSIGEKKFYPSAKVENELVKIGEFVKLCPNEPSVPLYICKIIEMWEDREGEKMFHGRWMSRTTDTVLGNTGDPRELFLVDQCEDNPLGSIMAKCTVIYKPQGEEQIDYTRHEDDGDIFFYQMWYDERQARFEQHLEDYHKRSEEEVGCISCLRQNRNRELEALRIEETTSCSSFHVRGEFYEIGDNIYLSPEAFDFKLEPAKCSKIDKNAQDKNVDDDKMYPEYYRKHSRRNPDAPEPFRIAEILAILAETNVAATKLKVRKFYRPENTHMGVEFARQKENNLLYWSSEEAIVDINYLMGKCTVSYQADQDNDECKYLYTSQEPDRFYFTEAYDSEKREFQDIPIKARKMSDTRKDKVQEKSQKELKTFDIFSGCGGLSEGLYQAGVADPCWGVEKDEHAALSYQKNNQGATVFVEDANQLLTLIMEGVSENSQGQQLPKKGDVELLCGGPPCQGFSGMNRFSDREKSSLKNSLVATYLSYCDYYRPRFFILENVRTFFSFKKSMMLKLTLRCLLMMGYQCTFGILQAGSYGVPQARRRAIILAAASGEKLPVFPEPTHCFSSMARPLSVSVDGKKYASNFKSVNSAPHRTVTVREAISDLPAIKNGAKADKISYGGEPKTDFQRKIRGVNKEAVLRDHVCKQMKPLVVARIQHIPKQPGSDWRDLPNITVQLPDGNSTEILRYTHLDKKNGNGSSGQIRGVCSCAEGAGCNPTDKQSNTLIPWRLPHTGNENNHWSGVLGRLEWEGFFRTTLTNPDPMGKQGRVLHPSEHRIVSVRECARSQGFLDSYRFIGSISDKHRQIGNAVPPPMAKAIGLEIKKCL
ncbi:DNA (cytosine-5)-methyltransferase 1-like isoform X2 [Dendronephthya gigantea]|uniref:DNA (cytosine-5)-methyltransferase 1-like isoform X2 n=1 Tax=Dendronephthya gigantea TaxID=151771 RepID=UPI00106B7E4F|nr:DNA (cytosine-5)-methyltransferase 1-like isoform X2 [Dendronephthya gigantea]